MSFVDLDLDVIIAPDKTYKVVDQDEFIEHQIKYGYDKALIKQAEQGVQTVTEDLQKCMYPFDGAVDEWIKQLKLGIDKG